MWLQIDTQGNSIATCVYNGQSWNNLNYKIKNVTLDYNPSRK